jgi:hypothetical protein
VKPRVSVITPYRDAAGFLADAIRSVKAQSIDDWELLLVDDRSSDDSVRIARSFAGQDPRIRMLGTSTETGFGAATARNIGLAATRGEFVAFLDADDVFLPKALETGLALAARNPSAALICGAARWWHSAGEGADWIDSISRIRPGLYEPPYLLDQMLLLQRDQVPCTCAILARCEAVRTAGGFDESLSLYEDQTLWARLMVRYPAYIGTHLTSLYRQHPGSASARAKQAGDYHRLRAHPARAAFLDWVGRDLADLAAPSTMSALRVAQTMLTGHSAHLSLAERARYMEIVLGKTWRRITKKSMRSARRLLGMTSTLPPVPQ